MSRYLNDYEEVMQKKYPRTNAKQTERLDAGKRLSQLRTSEKAKETDRQCLVRKEGEKGR